MRKFSQEIWYIYIYYIYNSFLLPVRVLLISFRCAQHEHVQAERLSRTHITYTQFVSLPVPVPPSLYSPAKFRISFVYVCA